MTALSLFHSCFRVVERDARGYVIHVTDLSTKGEWTVMIYSWQTAIRNFFESLQLDRHPSIFNRQ